MSNLNSPHKISSASAKDALKASTSTATNASTHVEATSAVSKGHKWAWRSIGTIKYKMRAVALYSVLSVTLGSVLIVGGAILCAPDMSKYEQRSKVLYDREGNIIYASLSKGDYLRIRTDAKDVDPLYLRMLLSSEDERFYYHPGVDPFAAIRAIISNLTAGSTVSGASTLAMQVCRMLEPKERNLWSKVKESLGALYITSVYGRDRILDMYLTLAPFGGNIEGVTAASYSYFNHAPDRLTPAEAALLVALPRSPELMRPDRRPLAAAFYRNEVLKKAVSDGLIESDILQTATIEPIPGVRFPLEHSSYYLGQSLFKGSLRTADLFAAAPISPPQTTDATASANSQQAGSNSAVDDAVANANAIHRESSGRSSLRSDRVAASSSTDDIRSLDAQLLAMDLPYEIVTSIDPEIQRVLLDAVDNYARLYVKDDGQDSVAVVAVDNETFEVKGYVGAVGAKHTYVDAAQAIRSPGSALKPFVYGMAFERGLLHPNTILLDSARMYRTYQPRNYDRKFFGEMSASLALQTSLNLPALDIMTAIGPVNFIRRLNSLPNTLPYERGTIYPPLESNYLLSAKKLSDVQYVDPDAPQLPPQQELLLQKQRSPHTATAQNATTAPTAQNATTTPTAQNAITAAAQLYDEQIYNQEAWAARENLSYPQGRLVLPKNGRPDISIALGGTGISLFDLTQLYAALANDGIIKPLRLTPVQHNTASRRFDDMDRTSLLNREIDPSGTKNQAITSSDAYAHKSSDTHAHKSSDAHAQNGLGNRAQNGLGNRAQLTAKHSGKLLERDAARAVFKILEGSAAPLGFYREDMKISYKTGTSFKSRDVWAIGSHENITVGVWIGRNDGSPTAGYTGYSNAAPVLFSIFNEIKTKPRRDLGPINSVLLQSTPPVALSRIEIKAIGRVQKRNRAKLNETKALASINSMQQSSTSTREMSSLSSLTTSDTASQASSNGANPMSSKLMVEPVQLVFPIDNSRINAGFSKRIMIQFKGGTGPYYVLINDEVHDRIDYFEPLHNGFYNVTVIDSTGKSASAQVFIQGIDSHAQTAKTQAMPPRP